MQLYVLLFMFFHVLSFYDFLCILRSKLHLLRVMSSKASLIPIVITVMIFMNKGAEMSNEQFIFFSIWSLIYAAHVPCQMMVPS